MPFFYTLQPNKRRMNEMRGEEGKSSNSNGSKKSICINSRQNFFFYFSESDRTLDDEVMGEIEIASWFELWRRATTERERKAAMLLGLVFSIHSL